MTTYMAYFHGNKKPRISLWMPKSKMAENTRNSKKKKMVKPAEPCSEPDFRSVKCKNSWNQHGSHFVSIAYQFQRKAAIAEMHRRHSGHKCSRWWCRPTCKWCKCPRHSYRHERFRAKSKATNNFSNVSLLIFCSSNFAAVTNQQQQKLVACGLQGSTWLFGAWRDGGASPPCAALLLLMSLD